MNLDGISTVTLILIFAFAIERLISGLRFLAAWAGWLKSRKLTAQEKIDYRSTAIFFVLAAVAATFAVYFFHLKGVLQILGLKQEDAYGLDYALTVLVLAAGAGCLGDLLKSSEGGSAAKSEPEIQVTGTLVMPPETEAELRDKLRRAGK